ncbi:MAG: hypothetical protein RSE58_05670 [Clostridia bacterium]
MYRLLIVTQSQDVKNMFASMEGWETLGFKPPRIRSDMDEAVECMHKHHIDAIALDKSPALEGLEAYLTKECPNLPIFAIEATPEEQLATIKEVFSLLTRLNADNSNDEYDDGYLLSQQRERWVKQAMSGLVATTDEMNKQLRLYRFRERSDVPCVLARLCLSDGESFLSERWHYGSERLETALRNFFGTQHDHMLLHVAVVSPEEVRVLCYPCQPEEGLSESVAYDFVQETVEQIEHYLGLELKVLDVCRVPGLNAFVSNKLAHS